MENYSEILEKLKQNFPAGTVQFTKSSTPRPYIPNQVYTDRLETATESRWDKEIKELAIHVEHRYVKAIVTIRIGPYSRDGYGVAVIDEDPLKDPQKISAAVDQAVNSAFVEAIDTYQMGWRDLIPHKTSARDWGSNPALQYIKDITEEPTESPNFLPKAITTHTCVKCKNPLTQAEWGLLKEIPNLNLEKLIYCYEDLPKHQKSKIPEKVHAAFLASRDLNNTN